MTTLLEPPEAVARDLEVGFDGRKLLFAMRANEMEPYHIHEMNADGTDLVQLTFGREVSDVDPAYLPDGRIVFASTRDPKYCGCNTSYLELRTKSPIRWHADAPGEAKALVKAVDDGPRQRSRQLRDYSQYSWRDRRRLRRTQHLGLVQYGAHLWSRFF